MEAVIAEITFSTKISGPSSRIIDLREIIKYIIIKCKLLTKYNDIFQEVLDHGDVKIMEEQLANAIESIVVSTLC